MKKALIVNLFPIHIPRSEAEHSATECFRLVDSLGDTIVVDMVHFYGKPHYAFFIGPGRAETLGEKIKNEHIDIIIINHIAKPKQMFNLMMMWSKGGYAITVWDRIDLILKIFEKHAQTAEAKLQIRLAIIRHMGPAMFGMGKILSQQMGGIGGRGIGETNLELMRRHWRDELLQVRKKLESIRKARMQQLVSRSKQGFATVSLVGYTNAGKSTLFNVLTGKKKLAANYLFATLDSAVGSVRGCVKNRKVMISDTIGFIENLPPQIIDAFTSTLMETHHSDLILHIIDMADSFMDKKITTVESILKEIGIDRKKKIYVFNKKDKAKRGLMKRYQEIYHDFHPVFVSAKNKIGINTLLRRIRKHLYTE